MIGFPGMEYFIESDEGKQQAIKWLYPNGFNPTVASEVTILASTNKAVDDWNETIQNLNPSELNSLFSDDKFCEVDDPYQHLQRNLKDRILNKFNSNGVPQHELKLKVNDVCIVLRPIHSFDLATNSRVRILQINPYRIKAQTLGENPRIVYIPRMRFKFRLPYGQSFQLLRTQFPLRLAYCMTYNKSQSQTLRKVLVDTTGEPFAHGHLYVAMSRNRNFDEIRLYIPETHTHPDGRWINGVEADMPIVKNIVYKSVLLNE